MAEGKKRTVLMSDKPSEVSASRPSMGKRLRRHLREKVRIKGMGLKYAPTKVDSIRAGAVRGKQPPAGTRARRARAGGGRFFGAMYKKKF